MKKLLLLFSLAIPMLLCAQTKAPKKNKLTVITLHPLQNETENFEKGLALHNKTFHSGDAAIDIYQVLVGDRTGEFHFVYRNLLPGQKLKMALMPLKPKTIQPIGKLMLANISTTKLHAIFMNKATIAICRLTWQT